MDNTTPTGGVIPYYIEMESIMKRLKELNKLDYPYKRTYRASDGSWITEDVPEYLEEQSLIKRWYELQKYDRALDPSYCGNHLLVSLRFDLIHADIAGIKYNPALTERIAVSVYKNRPIN